MLPHGRQVRLQEDVAGVGLEDDVAAEAAAQAVRALAVNVQVGAGRSGFAEGVDVEMRVGQAERRTDDPVLVGVEIIAEVEVAHILIAVGMAVGRFTKETDVAAVGVAVDTVAEETVDIETMVEISGVEAGRIAVDRGFAAGGICRRIGVGVVHEHASGEMRCHPETDAGRRADGGVVGTRGRRVGRVMVLVQVGEDGVAADEFTEAGGLRAGGILLGQIGIRAVGNDLAGGIPLGRRFGGGRSRGRRWRDGFGGRRTCRAGIIIDAVGRGLVERGRVRGEKRSERLAQAAVEKGRGDTDPAGIEPGVTSAQVGIDAVHFLHEEGRILEGDVP